MNRILLAVSILSLSLLTPIVTYAGGGELCPPSWNEGSDSLSLTTMHQGYRIVDGGDGLHSPIDVKIDACCWHKSSDGSLIVTERCVNDKHVEWLIRFGGERVEITDSPASSLFSSISICPQPPYSTAGIALYCGRGCRSTLYITRDGFRRVSSTFNPFATTYSDRYGHAIDETRGDTVLERFSNTRVDEWVRQPSNPLNIVNNRSYQSRSDRQDWTLVKCGQVAAYDALIPNSLSPVPSECQLSGWTREPLSQCARSADGVIFQRYGCCGDPRRGTCVDHSECEVESVPECGNHILEAGETCDTCPNDQPPGSCEPIPVPEPEPKPTPEPVPGPVEPVPGSVDCIELWRAVEKFCPIIKRIRVP